MDHENALNSLQAQPSGTERELGIRLLRDLRSDVSSYIRSGHPDADSFREIGSEIDSYLSGKIEGIRYNGNLIEDPIRIAEIYGRRLHNLTTSR